MLRFICSTNVRRRGGRKEIPPLPRCPPLQPSLYQLTRYFHAAERGGRGWGRARRRSARALGNDDNKAAFAEWRIHEREKNEELFSVFFSTSNLKNVNQIFLGFDRKKRNRLVRNIFEKLEPVLNRKPKMAAFSRPCSDFVSVP